MSKNFKLTNIGTLEELKAKGRVMVGEELALTGSELSFNAYPANQFTPFVHSHKLNEEVYIILNGDGKFMVDEDEFAVTEGDVIRIDPAGKRAVLAGANGLSYICIQAQKDSLTQATQADGVMEDVKASWM